MAILRCVPQCTRSTLRFVVRRATGRSQIDFAGLCTPTHRFWLFPGISQNFMNTRAAPRPQPSGPPRLRHTCLRARRPAARPRLRVYARGAQRPAPIYASIRIYARGASGPPRLRIYAHGASGPPRLRVYARGASGRPVYDALVATAMSTLSTLLSSVSDCASTGRQTTDGSRGLRRVSPDSVG